MVTVGKQPVVDKKLGPGDIENVAKQLIAELDLPSDYEGRLVNIANNAVAQCGYKTESFLIDHMRIVCRGLRAGARKEQHQKPKGYFYDMKKNDLWEYLEQNTHLLDLGRAKLSHEEPGLYRKLKETGLLDIVHPSHEGEYTRHKRKSSHKKGKPKQQAMIYNFGTYGRLRTASEPIEILAIEEILREENRNLFDMGCRFVRNCIDDKAEIRKACKEIYSQNPRLKTTLIYKTYDSAKRKMKGYVAIVVGIRR